MISIEDFSKIEIKIGTIKTAEPVEGSEKLLKLTVDFGEEVPRTVVSGIAKFVDVGTLPGRQFAFVTNLEFRQIMGFESQAMILAAKDAETLAILTPSKEISSGSLVK